MKETTESTGFRPEIPKPKCHLKNSSFPKNGLKIVDNFPPSPAVPPSNDQNCNLSPPMDI